MPPFWSVLGLQVNAEVGFAKAAFYKMARVYHPDKGRCPRAMAFLSMVLEASYEARAQGKVYAARG